MYIIYFLCLIDNLGFTRALNKHIPKLPYSDYSWLRRRIIKLDILDISLYDSLKYSNEPITIAIDSSGISVHKSGGWIERIHGKKKKYIKIHFAIDIKMFSLFLEVIYIPILS